MVELEKIGGYGGIVAMGCLARLKNGDYVTMFHDDGRFFRNAGKTDGYMRLFQTKSSDGGLTWSEPEELFKSKEVFLCEPGIIRSPNGRQLAVLLRENLRKNSHVIFSNDEAKTWTEPRAKCLERSRETATWLNTARMGASSSRSETPPSKAPRRVTG